MRFKHAALPVVADARVAIEELAPLLEGFRHVSCEYREAVDARSAAWRAEVERLFAQPGDAPFAQAEVVGAVNASAAAGDVVVVRGRQPARRSAQAVARAAAQHLSPRIRLLVHGL